ncbi:MAG: class I SAM-dependent methyltransferase [Sphingobacteriales bacterium]|jgi:2-polyprenyl-3-methyl-5-hydroxy-6-metoxy-1,4-benzoquinol methylase|nr:class I SAM-dependent methyltransferase [Sphingobacteriales bacterium]
MNYDNKPTGYYKAYRKEMLDFLPANAKTVLDIGCGNGALSAVLKEKYTIETWGIELMESEAEQAKEIMHKVYVGACENLIPQLPDAYFDAIYLNDVLEHLSNPNEVLKMLKPKLKETGVIISSIPNIRYHKAIIEIIFKKDFKYSESGILDFTHLRFFTSKSIQRMYTELGFEIISHKGINKSKSIKPYLYNLPMLFTAMDIFYPQFATVSKPKKQVL